MLASIIRMHVDAHHGWPGAVWANVILT